MNQAELRQTIVSNPIETRVSSHLSVRKQRTKVNRPRLVANVLLFLFSFSLLAVFVDSQSSLMGFRMVQLKKEIGQLETENKRLEFTAANLSSLERIQRVAETQLKMCKPQASHLVATIGTPQNTGTGIANAGAKAEQPRVSIIQRAYQYVVRMVDHSKSVGMSN
ncbi:MAG: hypothetical protein ACM3QZ_07355 [Solirubrobacterales bacterium]